MMLTGEQLQEVCPHCRAPEVVAAQLTVAAKAFGVQDLAMFVAQLAHESGEFRYVRELASGDAYEGRRDLGNDEAGDGSRYKGRGYLQITGKDNYRACGTALGLDLLGHPELLESPEYVASAAGWFWQSRHLNGLDIETCTRRINGGYNGLAQRRSYYQRALQVLGASDDQGV